MALCFGALIVQIIAMRAGTSNINQKFLNISNNQHPSNHKKISMKSEFFFGVAGKFAQLYGIDEICPVGGSPDPAIHREPAKEIVQCLWIIHHRRAKINKG